MRLPEHRGRSRVAHAAGVRAVRPELRLPQVAGDHRYLACALGSALRPPRIGACRIRPVSDVQRGGSSVRRWDRVRPCGAAT